MIRQTDGERRRDLGEFIRAQRERMVPSEIGLPAAGRRRTPGLRREEAAQICNVSLTWYTWLEQGRDVSASPHTLARIAAGLRLDRAGRAYLFELAGKRDPMAAGPHHEPAGRAVLDCVHLIAAPAYILDRTWTAVSWNAAAASLFGGWLDGDADRNLLRFIFLSPQAKALIDDWPARARRVAAEFRAAAGGQIDDPAIRRIVDTLHDRSRDFARYWDEHGVLAREGGVRTFNHPGRGLVRCEQITFALAGNSDLKLTLLTPASVDARAEARKTALRA
ncbi:MAG: helix-turn-helix domain-containing protein [Rhizobiaceae bacterium]|nr:helix-turn-helix domain-containing protein [Rhizobiaceae bacterium]